MNTTPPPIKNDEKANTLCILSIVLFILNPIINLLFNYITTNYDTINELIFLIQRFFTYGCGIGALVLLVIVRVNYPNNKFGKVLMWIYIILFTVSIILTFIFIVACGVAVGSCLQSLQGCGEIG